MSNDREARLAAKLAARQAEVLELGRQILQLVRAAQLPIYKDPEVVTRAGRDVDVGHLLVKALLAVEEDRPNGFDMLVGIGRAYTGWLGRRARKHQILTEYFERGCQAALDDLWDRGFPDDENALSRSERDLLTSISDQGPS